ncbi:HNH endonuclease [Vibrio sp. R78045]|uniref:HNH endonuclease n=1 Tax=Vibrio sp. R78045 TaxID=3093868 RepID=UPI0036F1B821
MSDSDVDTFFIGTTRNSHAISRMENPNFQDDNEEYQKVREEFITEHRARLHSDQEVQCEVCGLEMEKGAHVHHIDGDHTHNVKSNFSLRCPYCHLCEHIGFVGKENKGVIIYAPDISQASLNLLLVTCYTLRYSIDLLKEGSSERQKLESMILQVDSLVQAFESQKSIVLRNFQTDNPADFADKFLAMSQDEYDKRSVGTFSGLKLFFYPDGFESEIKTWAETIFKVGESKSNPLQPREWVSRAKVFQTQAKEVNE